MAGWAAASPFFAPKSGRYGVEVGLGDGLADASGDVCVLVDGLGDGLADATADGCGDGAGEDVVPAGVVPPVVPVGAVPAGATGVWSRARSPAVVPGATAVSGCVAA